MRGSWAQESSVRLIRWAAPTKMNRNILISEEYTVIRTHCPPIWACMKSLISKSKNLEISIIFFIFISKKKKKDKTFKNFRRNWPSQFQCDPSNMVIKANAILTKIRKILNCNHISYIFILKKFYEEEVKFFWCNNQIHRVLTLRPLTAPISLGCTYWKQSIFFCSNKNHARRHLPATAPTLLSISFLWNV